MRWLLFFDSATYCTIEGGQISEWSALPCTWEPKWPEPKWHAAAAVRRGRVPDGGLNLARSGGSGSRSTSSGSSSRGSRSSSSSSSSSSPRG